MEPQEVRPPPLGCQRLDQRRQHLLDGSHELRQSGPCQLHLLRQLHRVRWLLQDPIVQINQQCSVNRHDNLPHCLSWLHQACSHAVHALTLPYAVTSNHVDLLRLYAPQAAVNGARTGRKSVGDAAKQHHQ